MDELENYHLIPSCSSIIRISRNDIVYIRRYREKDYNYIIWFLKELNENFRHLESHIMMMTTLTNINEAFSLVIQQQK